LTRSAKRSAIDASGDGPSIERQCELLGLSRSSFYYHETEVSAEDRRLMSEIDKIHTAWPFFGVRRVTAYLRREGQSINPKRVRRLMRAMGLEAIYPKPRLSIGDASHRVYPYLLRGMAVTRPDQVWATNITYVPMSHGWMYLVAVMDWYSRCVISWALSSSLEQGFCVEALDAALERGRPTIFNSDQRSQFTSTGFTARLEEAGIRISMDGRGRAYDNIFVERLWRTVKYEEVYIKEYIDGKNAWDELSSYFRFYNMERPHQSLDYRTPAEVYGRQVGPLPGA